MKTDSKWKIESKCIKESPIYHNISQ